MRRAASVPSLEPDLNTDQRGDIVFEELFSGDDPEKLSPFEFDVAGLLDPGEYTLHASGEAMASPGGGMADSLGQYDITFTVVPEPSSVILLSLGALSMMMYGRRRR